MLHLALTGNAAAGKSEVAGLFEAWGATVLNADALVHRLQQPGTPVFQAIAARFGPAVITASGTLDRAALRSLIVADPAARADLEAIVHPAVIELRNQLLDRARHRGDEIVVSEIPLLFEAGDPTRYDKVVLVEAPDPLRLERLMRTRGLTLTAAQQLMATQLPSESKWAGADFIIDNSGSHEGLEAQARRVWQDLTGRRVADSPAADSPTA